MEEINKLTIIPQDPQPTPVVMGRRHPTKNGDEKPKDFTPGSDKEAWWLCEKNEDHEWEETVADRTIRRGGYCPYYLGKRAPEDDNLLANHPDVAREWHPTKNGNKIPENFPPGSTEIAWWLCERKHEWPAMIDHRTYGIGYPYCARKKATEDYNLIH